MSKSTRVFDSAKRLLETELEYRVEDGWKRGASLEQIASEAIIFWFSQGNRSRFRDINDESVILKKGHAPVRGDFLVPRDLGGWLEEFKKDMLLRFKTHDGKWKDASVLSQEFDFRTQMADHAWLRNEVHYHYSKWIYRGVFKGTMPEEEALTNLANMVFLLWIKLNVIQEEFDAKQPDTLEEAFGFEKPWGEP